MSMNRRSTATITNSMTCTILFPASLTLTLTRIYPTFSASND